MIEQSLDTASVELSADEKSALINYCLHLADTTLILGHRNSEWCGHGPILEQDIALTNISLDLIGQARNFYQYAAAMINEMPAENQQLFLDSNTGYNGELTEDSLAYLRSAPAFRNLVMCELPNGDWAQTVLRQFLFSNYQYLLYQQLLSSPISQLSAIAEKSLKEVTYHLRWSSEWVIRLGDGTDESKRRMKAATESLWPFIPELFSIAGFEKKSFGVPDILQFRNSWQKKTKEIFDEAGLQMPALDEPGLQGKEGQHTDHLSTLLKEMQELSRAFPGAQW
jgi:ring-1,2-phenylacetyl-CoA epoxidase subunit PaaC